MTEPVGGLLTCADCAYWTGVRDHTGLCRRWAPEPAGAPGMAAHWPQTRAQDGCGEGRRADDRPLAPACDECRHWRRPELGLNPVDRGDMPMKWWARAGYCVRHAPRPVNQPGPRAFWSATLDVDCCGEGERRAR